MKRYLLSRLLLLPLTLLVILLVNFAIIHLVPGDPTTLSSMGMGAVTLTGSANAQSQSFSMQREFFGQEKNRLFRSYYGLTLPLFFNMAYFHSTKRVEQEIELARSDRVARRALLDEAPALLPQLYEIACREKESALGELAYQVLLYGIIEARPDSRNVVDPLRAADAATPLGREVVACYIPAASFLEKLKRALVNTRLMRYLQRVVVLDFGTLRSNPNEKVVTAVVARLKYSLTLAIIPYAGTFLLSLFLGGWMAYLSTRGLWSRRLEHVIDHSLLFCYSIPVFMVAPFLLQLIVDGHLAFPLRGFTSPESLFTSFTTWERLKDIVWHVTLPVVCLSYTLLAAQCRLAKAAFLAAANQEMCRFAIAKGVTSRRLWAHHIVPNGALPLITSIAGSLGIILGGSVIVEMLFDLHGFGKFFYDAMIERDYNVLLFSSLAGSFLTLFGYCVSDLLLVLFDPRISFREPA